MQGAAQIKVPLYMTRSKTLQRLGIYVIFGQFQRFERDFGPGCTFVSPGRAQMAKYPGGQFACALTIPITTEDNNQFVIVDAGYENPVDIGHVIEEICYNYQHVRTSNLANMGVEPTI